MDFGNGGTSARQGAALTNLSKDCWVEFLSVDYTVDAPGQDRKQILKDITLQVQQGEFVAIVGRSGAGKTSLLNMVAGFISPTSGVVRLAGSVVEGPTRSTGYMFARDSLFPWRSALANVALALEARNAGYGKKEEREAEALAALKLVGLREAAHLLPRELSQGMRQRVALARTLVMQPKVLLLDEPFASLDVGTRGELQTLMRSLWERSTLTVILVTHDLREALASASKVITLAGTPGRIDSIIDVDSALGFGRDVASVQDTAKFVELHRDLTERVVGINRQGLAL